MGEGGRDQSTVQIISSFPDIVFQRQCTHQRSDYRTVGWEDQGKREKKKKAERTLQENFFLPICNLIYVYDDLKMPAKGAGKANRNLIHLEELR